MFYKRSTTLELPNLTLIYWRLNNKLRKDPQSPSMAVPKHQSKTTSHTVNVFLVCPKNLLLEFREKEAMELALRLKQPHPPSLGLYNLFQDMLDSKSGGNQPWKQYIYFQQFVNAAESMKDRQSRRIPHSPLKSCSHSQPATGHQAACCPTFTG